MVNPIRSQKRAVSLACAAIGKKRYRLKARRKARESVEYFAAHQLHTHMWQFAKSRHGLRLKRQRVKLDLLAI